MNVRIGNQNYNIPIAIAEQFPTIMELIPFHLFVKIVELIPLPIMLYPFCNRCGEITEYD